MNYREKADRLYVLSLLILTHGIALIVGIVVGAIAEHATYPLH